MTEASLAGPVYLTGFMGAGKSTVGAALAGRLRAPLVDTDALIRQVAGLSVAEIFRLHGEPFFRSLERRVVEEQLVDPSPRVVALGGGALLDRSLRLRALETGKLVWLRASAPELLRRLGGASGRPLLAGADAQAAALSLLTQREEGYAEAHLTLSTDGRPPEEIAEALVRELPGLDLAVAAGARSYPVSVLRGDAPLRSVLARLGPSSVVAVSDTNVAGHHEQAIRGWIAPHRGSLVLLDPGEPSKNLSTMGKLWGALSEAGVDRQGLVLGVGGGVVTDLAGFAASTWLRGVSWVAVPTSMLGMVDAAIGGKTAIDLGEAKNMVGAFHQPSAVLALPSMLKTEPERSFASGLAEVVKTALIGDAGLLSLLEEQTEAVLSRDLGVLERVVRGAAAVKVRVVSRDEREQGERRLLNLGHTLGHALEAQGGFARWTHGEAVALGTVAALRLGERLGVTEPGLTARVERLLERLGLPWRLSKGDIEAALPWLRHDKKRELERVRYVLVERPGVALVRLIALDELGAALTA